MTSEKECLCCREVAALNAQFDKLDILPQCLNRVVFRATYIMQRHVREMIHFCRTSSQTGTCTGKLKLEGVTIIY